MARLLIASHKVQALCRHDTVMPICGTCLRPFKPLRNAMERRRTKRQRRDQRLGHGGVPANAGRNRGKATQKIPAPLGATPAGTIDTLDEPPLAKTYVQRLMHDA